MTPSDVERLNETLSRAGAPTTDHPDYTSAEAIVVLAREPGDDWLYRVVTELCGRAPYLAATGQLGLDPRTPYGRRYGEEPVPPVVIPPKRGTLYHDHRVIIHVEENPKRKGTQSREFYDLYKVGQTLDEAREAGIPRGHILDDIRRGYIRVR